MSKIAATQTLIAVISLFVSCTREEPWSKEALPEIATLYSKTTTCSGAVIELYNCENKPLIYLSLPYCNEDTLEGTLGTVPFKAVRLAGGQKYALSQDCLQKLIQELSQSNQPLKLPRREVETVARLPCSML